MLKPLIFLGILCVSCNTVNGNVLKIGRIVGGSTISITEAPYTVAILADESNGVFSHICGGAILSPQRVLTAAQCTRGLPISFLRIRAGSTSQNSGGQVITVFSYRQHEDFNSITFNNDVAIVNLESAITLGPTASVITIAPENSTSVDGTPGTLTGWGRLLQGGPYPTALQKVTIWTINHNVCVSAYFGSNTVTPGMICAGRQGVGGVGACQGDTGGPLVVGGVLYGLASWGRGCGDPNYPSVFTKVSYYTRWIMAN